MMFRADLHCHSFFSDGTDSPEALIELALEAGLSGLSITDHDTVAAYPQSLHIAQKKGIFLLPGIEFSASHQGFPVHILGYSFSIESEAIRKLCEKHTNRRLNRNRKILQNLKKLGIEISEDNLKGGEGQAIGRPHIAKALIGKGIVTSIQEAFDKYLGEGKIAYDPGEPVSVLETIETIHRGKGKAILAHPHLLKRSTLIRQMMKMPFDGLEGYYARFTPELEKVWIDRGREKGWLITGGSDFHGKNKLFNVIGSSWVGKETFEILYEHYLASNP